MVFQNTENVMFYIDRIDVNGEVPRGRSWHGFTSVTDNILFMYGGYSQNEDPLGRFPPVICVYVIYNIHYKIIYI